MKYATIAIAGFISILSIKSTLAADLNYHCVNHGLNLPDLLFGNVMVSTDGENKPIGLTFFQYPTAALDGTPSLYTAGAPSVKSYGGSVTGYNFTALAHSTSPYESLTCNLFTENPLLLEGQVLLCQPKGFFTGVICSCVEEHGCDIAPPEEELAK